MNQTDDPVNEKNDAMNQTDDHVKEMSDTCKVQRGSSITGQIALKGIEYSQILWVSRT
jgi:hypothetical protein